MTASFPPNSFCSEMIPSAFGIVVAITLVLAVTVLRWVLRSYKRLRLFEDLGIPGPKPQLFWGNMKQMSKNRNEVLMQWKTKYGKMFGIYQGHEPFLAITDPDMVYECFVKQAGIFLDRPNFLVDVEPFRSSLFHLKGQEWKFVRQFQQHAFTSSKIRELSATANVCTTRFVESLTKAAGLSGSVDLTHYAMGYAVEFLMKGLLSSEVDGQRYHDNGVLESLMDLSKELDSAAIEVVFTMPLLRFVLSLLYPFTEHARRFNELVERVRNAVQSRRCGKSPRTKDVLQAILDAQSGDRNFSSKVGCERKNRIHDQYIFSNIAMFMFAGFDGMSATLSFLLYLLAKHPCEQDAILLEINECFPDKVGQLLSFDELRQLKRLDMVTKESQRIYPPVPVTLVRQCSEDTIVCGQFIPSGVTVLACPWLIHRDADIWPNPMLFLPERFAGSSTEIKRGAFFPLGLGPRKCIGKELGLLAVKAAVVGLLLSSTLSLKDKNAGPLRACSQALTLVPEGGINVILRPRTAKVDISRKETKY